MLYKKKLLFRFKKLGAKNCTYIVLKIHIVRYYRSQDIPRHVRTRDVPIYWQIIFFRRLL